MRKDRASLRQPSSGSGAALLALLVFTMPLPASPVWAAEPAPTTVKIDDSKAPTISIEARNVTVVVLLKELSSRLHFTVEGLSGLDQEQKMTVSSKGELEDILRRVVLSGTGFVAFHQGKTINRIMIVDMSGRHDRNFDAQSQLPAKPQAVPASTPIPSEAASAGAASTTTSTTKQAPIEQGRENDTLVQTQLNLQPQFNDSPVAPAQHGRLNALLQTQLNLERQFDTTGAPAPTAEGLATASSMAALTLTARQNVLALSAALRAVCIGPNCAQ
jgi:hypothetical protein